MSTVNLFITIYEDDGVFKHWAIFIDADKAEDKTILQVMGSDGRFRYEPNASDARDLPGLLELHFLCAVDVSKIDTIKDIAAKSPVQNEIKGWNCQDYVFDVLEVLERKGAVNAHDGTYRRQKNCLKGKQEGLV